MFTTFPNFTKLTLADKEEFQALVEGFPPISDISFTGLMTWWNPLGHLSVSKLNGNLVVPYWLPGDDKHSGLSLIGTDKVDESICAIFDYLKEKGEQPRLINVPEFVIANIEYPDMFNFKEERRYDEYVVKGARFYPLENMTERRRKRVEKRLKGVGKDTITVKSLDLSSKENKAFLLAAASGWQQKNINNYGKLEQEATRAALMHPIELGIQNVCLFVGEELHGFCLYEVPADKDYVIVNCVKATHRSSLGFELMAYEFAKWFMDQGVKYGNLNSDFGMLRLRMFMLTLGPTNFFRKYRIEPA